MKKLPMDLGFQSSLHWIEKFNSESAFLEKCSVSLEGDIDRKTINKKYFSLMLFAAIHQKICIGRNNSRSAANEMLLLDLEISE